ncbi:MAG: DUF2752 domain-containing protein [Terriglobia bacterium]
MAAFSKGIPRWMVLSLAMAICAAVPPEWLARGPDLCLWKHLFHLAACPACGSTRALAAFFHGRLTQALAYNRNVIVTGPLLVGLLVQDAALSFRKWIAQT